MPTYLYQSPKTGEIKEIIQRISEPHEYKEGNVVWRRVFTVPNAATDTKLNIFSSQDFAEKTKNKKGTLGDLFDRSREASEARERKIGKDPVKEKYWKNWSKARRGRKPPTLNSDSVIEV